MTERIKIKGPKENRSAFLSKMAHICIFILHQVLLGVALL